MPRTLAIILLALAAGTAWAEAAVAPPQLVDPAEAADLIEEADATPYEGAEQLILFDRTQVEVEDSGLCHRYEHRLVKVLEPGGARALRALRFDFDPASNDVQILGLRVHREDGAVEDVDATQAVDTTAPASGIYWGARMKVIGLPALSPGDAVESLAYTKGFLIAYLGEGATGAGDAAEDEERFIPPMRGHFYDVVAFQGGRPSLETRYELYLPRDKPLQYSVYNGEVASSLSFAEGHFVYRFWREDVPAVEREPRMPDLTDLVPKVVMATAENWEAKSRWFYDTNEWVFDSTPEIDELVADITRGLDEDEAIAALLHWVAQNIRYSGLSMGEGEGYTIHPSEMTIRDRCGVCKDIAGMLVTMLRVAGFETYAAMTMAGARVEAVPADQFNHCVVALKKDDGDYLMLDPTWAPWNNPLWSRWEGEQHFVIGTPWGESRMMIPAFTPEQNRMLVESQARLDEKGDLAGTLTFTGSGIADGRLRSVAADRPIRDRERYIEGWLARIAPAARLLDWSISDHRDFGRDTRLELKYEIPGYADARGGRLAFASPALALAADNSLLNRLAGAPRDEERRWDLFMWGPQALVIEETITLPKKFDLDPPEDLDQPGGWASARRSWTVDGRKLKLDAEAVLARRLIPVEHYDEVREAAESFADGAELTLVAAREGGSE